MSFHPLAEFTSGNFLYRLGSVDTSDSVSLAVVMNLLAPPLSFREVQILPKSITMPSVVVLDKMAYLIDNTDTPSGSRLLYSHLEFSGELNRFRLYPSPLPVRVTHATLALVDRHLVIRGRATGGTRVEIIGNLDTEDWLEKITQEVKRYANE